MQCSRATVNRVRTRFPKETEEMNRETVSRVVFIVFLDLLTQQMLRNLFMMATRIGHVESRREQARLQEELSMNEKLLQDTQIRNIHELEEMKRAQDLRVDEVSVQELRENHETIQQLTSHLQEMQEQMNSMTNSGNFQEVASN